MFHLRDILFMSMEQSYAFPSINVPYSVEEEKSIRKTVIRGNEV